MNKNKWCISFLVVLCIFIVMLAYALGYDQGKDIAILQRQQAMSIAKQYEGIALQCIESRYEQLKIVSDIKGEYNNDAP